MKSDGSPWTLYPIYIQILFPNCGLQFFPPPEVDRVAKHAKFFLCFALLLSTTCSTHKSKNPYNEGFWGASKLTQNNKQQIKFLSVM
jgi:hypothetical protein